MSFHPLVGIMYERTIFIGVMYSIIICALSTLIFYLSLGPCPQGTFSCDSGQLCVPQRHICDNRADCEDGSDEHPVECGLLYGSTVMTNKIIRNAMEQKKHEDKQLYNEKMERQKNITVVHYPFNSTGPNITKTHGNGESLFNNKIKLNILGNNCEIPNFPSKCSCHQRTLLYCGPQANLSRIPTLGGNITNLIVIQNNITLENKTLSTYKNLRKLKLKFNNIIHLPRELFSHLALLEQLDIRFNNLSTLPEGIFRNLKSLQWLFLASNHLRLVNISDMVSKLPNLEWLVLTDNLLTLRGQHFPYMANLLELYLDYNRISYIGFETFAQLENLHLLNLNGNRITHLQPKAFWGLKNIRDIRLMNNPLKQLSMETFTVNSQLEALSLAHTPLYISRTFMGSLNISYLNLSGIHYMSIDFEAINRLRNLKYIIYDRFYLCSMTPNVRMCKPNTDGVSSFRDLLSKPILRYTTWTMSVLIISGNIMVFWGRFKYPDENASVSIVIRSLALADLLMGFYLLIIAILDFRYRNKYHRVALDWTTSWYCVAMGIMAVSSSEVSILILSFMSLERFLLIANPFHSHYRISIRFIILVLITIWTMGVGIAVIPVVLWHSSTKFYGTYSGICFPLHIQEPYPLGWQYSAFVFLGLNLYLVIMIAILYLALLISIHRTQSATPLSFSECEFTIRFFFIVFIDILCWFPIIVMKVRVFFNYNISDDVYGWLVVFILPLNSAVNPLLYTFTTPKYRHEVLFEGWKKIITRYHISTSTDVPD